MYPTKEQIMEKEQKFKPGTIAIIKTWKKTVWINNENTEFGKYMSLEILATILGEHYKKPVKVKYKPEDKTCSYSPSEKTIFINKTNSIISLLHEFAHHIHGKNETKACRWSIWLFKKTFPKTFNKLNWNGHMLIK